MKYLFVALIILSAAPAMSTPVAHQINNYFNFKAFKTCKDKAGVKYELGYAEVETIGYEGERIISKSERLFRVSLDSQKNTEILGYTSTFGSPSDLYRTSFSVFDKKRNMHLNIGYAILYVSDSKENNHIGMIDLYQEPSFKKLVPTEVSKYFTDGPQKVVCK